MLHPNSVYQQVYLRLRGTGGNRTVVGKCRIATSNKATSIVDDLVRDFTLFGENVILTRILSDVYFPVVFHYGIRTERIC